MSDAPPLSGERWLETFDRLLAELVDQQERKLLELARQIVRGLTPEDLRNPQDFPALARDPQFNYEDGLLAGLRSALIAVRAERRQPSSTKFQ